MMATRLFVAGIVMLFIGIQLRLVDSFVLNEQVTQIIEKRFPNKGTEQASLLDPNFSLASFEGQSNVTKRRLSPPRWLGYSILSVAAVLIVTSPAFRR